MKKIVITVLSVFALSSLSYAQSTSEILQLAQNQNLGTARFNGLSGAFGALGGDLTALSQNPAGAAVFSNSYGSITLGRGGGISRSNYFGTITEKDDATFDFNQIGGVLILKNTTASSGPSKIALGLAYNKINDFRDEFRISSNSVTNSIADFFVGQANGLETGALISNGRSDRQAYLDLSDGLDGRRNQQSYLGFQSILIDAINPNDDNNINYKSNVSSIENFQDYLVRTSGNSGKVTFNLGLEFQKNLFLGANINIHSIDRTKRTSLLEENDFARFAYEIYQRTLGTGFSFDLGGIFVVDNLRFGLSYETPTWLELADEVNEFTNTDFAQTQNINGIDSDFVDIDPNVTVEFEPYQLRNPGTIHASFAYIAGKDGLISAQYSRKDYSNIKYTSDGDAFDELNSIIKNTFQAVNIFRIGGEWRYENWRFRGGLSKITSPYKNNRIVGDTNGFSLGTGYNWGKWKLDIAYNHVRSDRVETLFESANFNNSATINKKDDVVSMTLGVNF